MLMTLRASHEKACDATPSLLLVWQQTMFAMDEFSYVLFQQILRFAAVEKEAHDNDQA